MGAGGSQGVDHQARPLRSLDLAPGPQATAAGPLRQQNSAGRDRHHTCAQGGRDLMLAQLSGFDSRSQIFFRANCLKINESR
jgi:hypothetical protein